MRFTITSAIIHFSIFLIAASYLALAVLVETTRRNGKK
jgi:hypothetical protein